MGIFQFILKYNIEVLQKEMQKLVELVHFHPTISALSVMNELRKDERFVLTWYLSYCSLFPEALLFFNRKQCASICLAVLY